MEGLLVFVFVTLSTLVGFNASVIRNDSRIANGVDASAGSLYACMVFVINDPEFGAGNARLGGGTIISIKHVLTTASLTSGNGNKFQIGYRTRGGTNFNRIDATVVVPNPNYNPLTFENDIAIIVLPYGPQQFPPQCIIGISRISSAPATGTAGTVVAYGFTSPSDTGASKIAYSAAQTVGSVGDCSAKSSQFCASGTQAVLCPGDAGSGFVVSADGGSTYDRKLMVRADDDTTEHPTDLPTESTSELPTPPTRSTTLPPSTDTTTESTTTATTPTTSTPPTTTPTTTSTTQKPGPVLTIVGLVSKLSNTNCKTPASTIFTIVGLYESWISAIADLPPSQAIKFL